MNTNMNEPIWGVPTAGRTRKEEQFNVPVLTMSALLKDGANRKFSFNKAAIKELNLIGKESHIQVGFRGTEVLVKNIGDLVVPSNSFLLAGNNSFSDKKTFEFIIKLKELNTEVENHLHLVQVEGQSYFTVSKITSDHSSGDQLLEEVIVAHVETDDEYNKRVTEIEGEPEEVIDEIVTEIPGVTANEEVEEVWETEATPAFEAPLVEKAIIKPVVKKAAPIAKAEPKPTAVKFAIDNTEDDGFSDSPVVNAPEVEDDGFGNPVADATDEDVW